MNEELLRGVTSAADRDALSRLPSDPLADLRQALDTIAKASQVIVVHPEHREVADQAVAASPFPGLLEVVVSQHAPRDRVYLMPKPSSSDPAPDPAGDCWCGADGGEGCWCCTDECPEDCMADHKGEQ